MLDYYYFTIEGLPKPLGYVHASIIRNVTWPSYWAIDADRRILHLQVEPSTPNALDVRSSLVDETIALAKSEGKIKELSGCGETVAVRSFQGEHVLNMNSLGTQIFGVTARAV